MPRLIWILLITIVPHLVSGCASLTDASRDGQIVERDGPYQMPKLIRYSFTLNNTTGRPLEKAEFRTYAPVPQTSYQKVKKISANQPYRITRDEVGNEIMHFDLENIPPYGAKIISITVNLLMAERPVSMSVGDRQRFLKPEIYIESDDIQIVNHAKTLSDPVPLTSAKKAYEWVNQNLFSENYVSEDRGAVYAFTHHKGDCTEYSYLLTALYRAQQIPARALGGYVFSGNSVVKAVDYHNWTEFHADGVWQVADAQKGAFAKNQTDYVAMRIIASGKEGPMGDSHRFNFAGEGLKVTMN